MSLRGGRSSRRSNPYIGQEIASQSTLAMTLEDAEIASQSTVAMTLEEAEIASVAALLRNDILREC